MDDAARLRQVERYFTCLTASDIPGIVALFAPEATVLSPFLGKMPAPAFFAKLGAASAVNRLTVFDILLAPDGSSAAAHFEYDWTLKSGDQIVFQGMDYFRFAPDAAFASLSIFYDTHPVRADVGDKYA